MGKRLMIVAAAAAAVGSIAGAPLARAGSASLLASKDNTLFEHPDGLFSNGAGQYLFVGETSAFGLRRGLVAFDLPSAIPTNAFVTLASLDVVISRAQLQSNATLHVVTQNWGEGASDAGDPGGGGAVSQTGDATWKHAFFGSTLWNNLGGDFNPAASATTSMGFGGSTFADPQMAVDVQNWVANPATNFGWLMKGEEGVSQSAKRIDSRETGSSIGPTLNVSWNASTWNVGGGGAWSSNANWLLGVPGGVGAEANFFFSSGAAPIAVNVDGPRTVGFLNFDSNNPYTLSGSAITLDRAGNHSSVSVAQGSHQIQTTLNLDTITDFDIDTGAALHVTTGLTGPAANSIINKNGDGTLRAARIRNADLIISGGAVVTDANGSAAGISVLNDLQMAAATTLDLANNDLIVNGGNYTTLRDLVIAGVGNPTGIISSTSDGSQILALFDNAQVGATDWEGIPVALNSVIGKYTYFGDANIDGQVTGDDYTVIDANLSTTPPDGLGWLSGDMNLDGTVTGDDYTVIDANLGLGAGNPLSGSQLVAIPEPVSILLLSASALHSFLRRKR